MMDKNKAVVCCLLATSAIMLSENNKGKSKIWSKKWYLKRNISCDAHLLHELLGTECLEMMPSWCRQGNWGKCGIPWVNCAVLCVKDDWKGQFWGLRYSLSKLRSLLSFPSGMTSHSKLAQFDWECLARFKDFVYSLVFLLNNTSNLWFYIAFCCCVVSFFFSGTLAKLRNATISFVMPACSPVHPHGTTWFPNGRIFMKFDIWIFFVKLSRKFKFH